MDRRTLLGAAVAATGLLAVPAGASATTVVAGPIKVKAYEMTIVGSDAGTLSVLLSRHAGSSTQAHTYMFAKGAKVKAGGTHASIVARLGRYGSIKLALSGGRATRGKVPANCTGTAGRSVAGTLHGKVRFVADRSYFKTISARSLKGAVLYGGRLRCSGTGGTTKGGPGGGTTGHTLRLTATRAGASGVASLTISKAPGGVTEQVMTAEPQARTQPATVSHMIVATAKGGALQTSADLSSATAKSVAPFLRGTLSFAGQGSGSFASGQLSGSFAAHFDSIGTVGFHSGQASLMRQEPA